MLIQVLMYDVMLVQVTCKNNLKVGHTLSDGAEVSVCVRVRGQAGCYQDTSGCSLTLVSLYCVSLHCLPTVSSDISNLGCVLGNLILLPLFHQFMKYLFLSYDQLLKFC